MRLTDQELSARKRRNLWIAAGLVAFMVLIFLTTFLRMQRNMEEARAAREGVVAEAPR
ncbi:MAG: hypothetical protein KJ676_04150 [Alphaproteobacteria bacterium]|nr:hypothetical protein [Alphaproteobacteria bacterium]MBU1525046.1 hypothetical protein [Alphaproteobacteria bacterium]MBU2116668.1 hypothetical protein [Alphaproteobacteria bacterium]MBU2351368.1 hypothetical protein [Alphaproteobacteria bacterium]MBU2383587.1 hypothetical protein [Alphaproteobacteria bacterium]